MPPKRKLVAAGSESKRPPPPGPKKITGGNSICDQDWIADMLEDGSLRLIDPAERPPGFLYDVLYQWSEPGEALNPDFFEFYRWATGAKTGGVIRKCNSTAYVRDQRGGYVVDVDWVRLKRPCLTNPGKGTNVCHSHGSQIPVVKAAAQRALAEAAEIVALRLVGLTGTKDEVNETIMHKDRISAANSVLDRAGIKGGVDVEITTPGYKRVIEKLFGDDSDE